MKPELESVFNEMKRFKVKDYFENNKNNPLFKQAVKAINVASQKTSNKTSDYQENWSYLADKVVGKEGHLD